MSGGVLALRSAQGRLARRTPDAVEATATTRPRRRRKGTALQQTAPAPIVTFSGVQGGAGTSTAAMLLATAVTLASDAQALAVDVAGATAGGLGGLARGWSQVPARTMAQLMLEGAKIGRPYVTTAAGVHAITAPPDEHVRSDITSHALVGAVQNAMRRGASDSEIAALCRDAVDATGLGYHHELGDEATAALASFLQRARPVYSLITLDLGVGEQQALKPLLSVSDLHVWVVSARRDDLECVRARLMVQPRLAQQEVLLVWVPAGGAIKQRELRVLGAERGCPLVKLPTIPWKDDWADRVSACGASMEALCRLLS